MERPGEAVSRFELLERVWDDAYEHRSNVIDVYVGYLRDKVDRPFGTTRSRPSAGSVTGCAREPAHEGHARVHRDAGGGAHRGRRLPLRALRGRPAREPGPRPALAGRAARRRGGARRGDRAAARTHRGSRPTRTWRRCSPPTGRWSRATRAATRAAAHAPRSCERAQRGRAVRRPPGGRAPRRGACGCSRVRFAAEGAPRWSWSGSRREEVDETADHAAAARGSRPRRRAPGRRRGRLARGGGRGAAGERGARARAALRGGRQSRAADAAGGAEVRARGDADGGRRSRGPEKGGCLSRGGGRPHATARRRPARAGAVGHRGARAA